MTEKEYQKLAEKIAPRSSFGKDFLGAFLVGGIICSIGQFFINYYTKLGLEKTEASTAASMTLVAISAILTGLSLYDDIAGCGIQNRGIYPGRGCEDVYNCRAGDRIWTFCKCGVWFYLLALDYFLDAGLLNKEVLLFSMH